MSDFFSVHIEDCAAKRHMLTVAGSDKTPMKKNIICDTCSLLHGRTAYAAWGRGMEEKGFGAWPTRRRSEATGD